MKNLLPNLTLALIFLLGTQARAQFAFSDIQYWVGSGSDSSVLVVDFLEASQDTAFAWGFLHDGTATGEDMLNAIAAADINFSVNIGSGFLNDIIYGENSGIGGTSGFFWATWSGMSIDSLALNTGISEGLSNGDWFGCSFTDFSPAIPPGNPIPAFDPLRFTIADVEFFVGSGPDTSILVIDFLTPSGASSFAWGYVYSGIATGEQMLNDIAAADPNLTVNIGGGFLNDITYDALAGIGGSPNFWGTWSATNLGNWGLNIGIGDTLQNGSFFGCSYTDFNPPIRPGYPSAVPLVTSMVEFDITNTYFTVYPNPARDWVNLDFKENYSPFNQVSIIDLTGKVVWQADHLPRTATIPVQHLSPGAYTLLISNGSKMGSKRFIRQ